MNDCIEVHHKGVTIRITSSQSSKGGVVYKSYQFSDYRMGKRKRRTFADPTQARKEAMEMAEAMATGQDGSMDSQPYVPGVLEDVLAEIERRKLPIRPRRMLEIMRDALELVAPEEIVVACQHWRDSQPEGRFSPKRVVEAVGQYLERQQHLSARRQRTLASYFNPFTKKFGRQCLHEITTADIKDLIRAWKGWASAKTRNEVKGALGLLYRDAQDRGLVPKGCNPAAGVKWEKIRAQDVGIYLPDQVRRILHSLEDDLALPMAVWFFGGCRKENLIRIQFSALRTALKTGFLKITADDDLKTGARIVKLEPNLKAWIEWYLSLHPDASGPVLPARHGEGRKLDNVTRKITRRSGIEWVGNAPRHTCLSMWLARGENVQSVAKWAGNSLGQIQKHYWNRDESVTADLAKAYFAILPPGWENISDSPGPNTAKVPELVLPAARREDFVNN